LVVDACLLLGWLCKDVSNAKNMEIVSVIIV
jgi:hypothetical protein